MLKIVSENFIHALLLFLGLFLKISRWVPLHTYLDIFENGDFFSVLGYRPHVSGHQKRRFLKAFPRIKIFENIVLPFSIELTKTEVSDYDHNDVIHHT